MKYSQHFCTFCLPLWVSMSKYMCICPFPSVYGFGLPIMGKGYQLGKGLPITERATNLVLRHNFKSGNDRENWTRGVRVGHGTNVTPALFWISGKRWFYQRFARDSRWPEGWQSQEDRGERSNPLFAAASVFAKFESHSFSWEVIKNAGSQLAQKQMQYISVMRLKDQKELRFCSEFYK